MAGARDLLWTGAAAQIDLHFQPLGILRDNRRGPPPVVIRPRGGSAIYPKSQESGENRQNVTFKGLAFQPDKSAGPPSAAHVTPLIRISTHEIPAVNAGISWCFVIQTY